MAPRKRKADVTQTEGKTQESKRKTRGSTLNSRSVSGLKSAEKRKQNETEKAKLKKSSKDVNKTKECNGKVVPRTTRTTKEDRKTNVPGEKKTRIKTSGSIITAPKTKANGPENKMSAKSDPKTTRSKSVTTTTRSKPAEVEQIVGARRKRKVDVVDEVPKKIARSRSCRATIEVATRSQSSPIKRNKDILSGKEQSNKKESNKDSKAKKMASTEKVESKEKRSAGRKKKCEENLKVVLSQPEKISKKSRSQANENANKNVSVTSGAKSKLKENSTQLAGKLTSKAILDLLSDIEDEPVVSIGSVTQISKKKSIPVKKTVLQKKNINKRRSSSAGPKEIEQSNITNNLEVSKNSSQIPIWKRMDTFREEDEFTGGDIYDPDAYHCQEDDAGIGKKKKARKRKKETAAILVFGNKKNVREAVKEIHNLKTPPPAKKAVANAGRIKHASADLIFPATSDTFPSVPPVPDVYVSSDVSSGAHAFFDSFQGASSIQADEMTSLHATSTTNNLLQPKARLHNIPAPSGLGNDKQPQTTPVIPKNFAKRLQVQKDQISTPKLDIQQEDNSQVEETTKDMIKNAFGFDSEDSEDDLSCGESIISPVKKLTTGHSFFDASKQFDSRMSTTSFRDPEPVKTSLWRFDVEKVSRPRAELYKQIHAMEKERMEQGLAKLKNKHFSKATRSSPRKVQPVASSHQDQELQMLTTSRKRQPEAEMMTAIGPESADTCPTSALEVDDTGLADAEQEFTEDEQSSQQTTRQSPRKALGARNAFEVMKSAQTGEHRPTKVKKLTKKPTKKADMNDSSMLEDRINKGTEVRRKIQSKRPSVMSSVKSLDNYLSSKSMIGHSHQQKSSTSASDKENSKDDNHSNKTMPVKTYSMNNSKTSGRTFNQSVSSPSKKQTKKEKKIASWAALQTSHFSEIEDFDISFV